MRRAKNAFLNNGSSTSSEVEITRGTFVAALTGIVNVVLIFTPLDDNTKLNLLASLSPTIVIVSHMLFAAYDGWYDRTFGA
jgi:uncharacterized membrane protein YjdF